MFRAIAQLLGRTPLRGNEQHELFVHEDEWGQIELLPSAAAPWCAGQMRQIGIFSEQHTAQDRTGWTDIYVRSEAPSTLSQLDIAFAGACKRLNDELRRFDRVVSGTFSSPQPIARVAAFGPAHTTGIVLTPDRSGNKVDAGSLVLNGPADECAAVLAAAGKMAASTDMIAVDWTRASIVRLTDVMAVRRYVEAIRG